ncbi:MAG TPA: hypothetical protein VK034_06060, partial [Enhygromyxa sp.]|nr:hypothetical protein [Enhygromyxa sp.]
EAKQNQDRRPAHLLVRFISSRASVERKEWDHDNLKVPKPLRRGELEAITKRAHFQDDGLAGGSLFPSRVELAPAEFWPRLEEVIFTPLVERAFAGADEEGQ